MTLGWFGAGGRFRELTLETIGELALRSGWAQTKNGLRGRNAMLTECPECRSDVSDKATACPKCGHPAAPTVAAAAPVSVERQLGREFRAHRIVVVLLLVVIALLAAVWLPGLLRSSARSRLIASPSNYITAGRVWFHDKGIINTYTKATQIEFTNNSDFDVSELRGKVTYLAANGAEMAVVPFTSVAEVRAHFKTAVAVDAGEISGGASGAHVRVESVRVRD